ncbi:ASCH domain-containing protein [Phenylobacterium sp. LjRoot219]|uniref:ASCH domain-containing protein n=1 Tax=Phenylobacterium sp. LjRoot219 TaxID=3342283 RepID=UPI003ECE3337
MKVLLSIKPEYVERIFDGTKRYEFRRRPYTNRNVKTVVVYATKPVGKIVGEFDVDDILGQAPDDLWRETAALSGISRDFFDAYFEGREVAYALKIGAVRAYAEPIAPEAVMENFTAPQSYMYLSDQAPADWRPSQPQLI